MGTVPGSVETLIQGCVASPEPRARGIETERKQRHEDDDHLLPALATAANVHSLVELTEGFGQFCLTAGIESLAR